MSPELAIPVFLILLASLSVHEAAHAWAANKLGDPTARLLGRLTLNPLAHIDWIGTVAFPIILALSNLPVFGWAKPVPVDMRNLQSPRRDFALVALAGPVSNVVLAAGFILLLQAQGGLVPETGVTSTSVVLYLAIFLNLILAAFNMLPIPPLDGGNVLAGLLPESMARVVDQVRPFGAFVILGLFLMGALDYLYDPIERLLGTLLL
ncbi:MAG: site-2 protease family protein [Acidimicrobiia bacterium]|nr:site-2 protease family protein [Acidimicrobiia bacterium]